MSVRSILSAVTGSVVSVSVRCRLFGRYAELLGRNEVALALASPATADDAVQALRNTAPRGDQLPVAPLVAVNLQHVGGEHVLADGDEVALLPPLAGG